MLILGAPKAGTTALHAALARHPDVFASPVKEPKYYLCADAPPPAYAGPGDAHSRREWVWRRDDYRRLFADAPPGALRLESTPCYLYSAVARRRIAEELPDARLIVVVRDPIERAYSNWMHLWVDGRAGTDRGLRRRLARRGPADGPPAGPRSGTTGGSAATASSWPTC